MSGGMPVPGERRVSLTGTALRIVLPLVAIVVVAHLGASWLHQALGLAASWRWALLETVVLTALVAPVLWIVAIRPLHRAQAAARERTEGRLRIQAAALDAADNAIAITDRAYQIEWVNRAFVRMTGYALAEIAGRTPQFLRAGTADAATYEDTARAVAAGASWRGEVLNRRKDGSIYTAAVALTPVRDERGEIVHYVAVAEDVTERRALEAQLRQAQKIEAVGQLAGGIAHDFNNLLTTIIASAGLLAEHVPERTPAAEEVELVRHSAERGAELTQKLLAFSRRQRLELKTVDLAELVGDFSRMARRLLREDISLSLALAEPAWVRADPAAVEEMLMNLVTNARDAMPDGGSLAIATERRTVGPEDTGTHFLAAPGEYVALAVTDTGTGMTPEVQRRLFEPFFTTKPVGSGTGLGLSMVYGLIKQHGGSVLFYSEVGRGTTVRLYFPAAGVGTAARPRADETELRGGTETILVAEDEADLRRATKRVLERYGYTVHVAADGAEALETLARIDGQVALVVTDVVMPRMGGVRLYNAIRGGGHTMPVLFTSGYTARDIEETRGLDVGVPFLTKPWTMSELVRRVREVLDER